MIDPTPEQVEAARAEYDRSEDMCAALVAAAGVTPEEPSGCICTWHSEDRGGGYSELVIEPEPDCAEHGAGIAAPVQVDEAKLAEVVRNVIDRRPYEDETRRDIRGLEIAVARAVAEWFRGGGQ